MFAVMAVTLGYAIGHTASSVDPDSLEHIRALSVGTRSRGVTRPRRIAIFNQYGANREIGVKRLAGVPQL